MGNTNSSGGGGIGRRRRRRRDSPVAPPPEMQVPGNQHGFESATPYPAQFPNPNPNSHQFYQYPGYYQPSAGAMPIASPPPYDHPHHQYNPWAAGGRYPCGPMMPPPLPYVEHQKAVTIRNDVNLMKDTLRLEHDEENPGQFLVSFTFNATVSGRITVIFFAKEGEECNLTGTKEEILAPVTVNFQQGLGQKFRQPSGTGIELSAFEDSELVQKAETEIYPLAVKAEGIQVDNPSGSGATNSQITLAVFEKEKKGEFKVRVVKQILWVNGMRYELQEIYGIENSVEDDDSDKTSDASEQGKECVICLSEPRDTTVLPCRHMCLCSGCAKVLRYQTNRCPICRQPVERLLEIKVKNNGGEK